MSQSAQPTNPARAGAAARTLIALALLVATLPAPAQAALEGTVKLPVSTGEDPSEPHLAINPSNPNNMVVVSHLTAAPYDFDPGTLPALVNKLAFWVTTDGGTTWTPGTFVGKAFEGLRTVGSDPVVAYAADGTAYYAGMSLPYKRWSWQSLVILGRSTDGGQTFAQDGVIVRTNNKGNLRAASGAGIFTGGLNDKEWIAVDQTSGPFGGSIYAVWDKVKRRVQDVLFSRKPPGASTFTEPVRLASKSAFPQIVVRPNGVIDLVWLDLTETMAGASEGALGNVKIVHVASTDGGTSFTAPQTVAEIDSGVADIPTLAVSASGKLLACWAQVLSKDIDFERDLPKKESIACSGSADGLAWSPPTLLDPGEDGVNLLSLPAATAQGERFWVSAYAASRHKTRVLLFRSDDSGTSFARDRTLATRHYGAEVSKFVGDYTGLAATGNRLVATYALSKRARLRSRIELFVTALTTS